MHACFRPGWFLLIPFLSSYSAGGPQAGWSRPACPSGWTEFDHPAIGMQAHVPPGYWVRLRGGVMLTVENAENPATLAFLMPLRPQGGASASAVANAFARFVAQSDPQMRAELAGTPTRERASARFTGVMSGQSIEGRYCALLAAGGSMGYVVGVAAPRGQLASSLPTLQRIANGFGFRPPRLRWMEYRSPAGGFTMQLPEGWQVQSSDGRNPKDNVDWVAIDPQEPSTRAFQWCPRFCSPQLLQDPTHMMSGYQAAAFQNHRDVVVASLSQITGNVRLAKMSVNEPLTAMFRNMQRDLARYLANLNAAKLEITVYDCLAEADVEGRHVTVAFVTGIQTMAINAGITGTLYDLSLTQRGWCARPERFVADSPVLEKVCASMQLTPAFIRRVVQGNEHAANVIHQTYQDMARIDDQIRQSHWDTMDAVAEMNYDALRDTGGYVNQATGRIEQIPADRRVVNARGELVSREEVERGIDVNQATVLREADSDDYMRGIYGRVEFP